MGMFLYTVMHNILTDTHFLLI